MDIGTNHRLNVTLLSKELAKKAWWSTFWAKIAGFQEITNVNGIRQTIPAPNVIVQVIKDFIQEGRDSLLMPMLMPLEEDPIYGDTWLKGTGEDLSLKYMSVYINQVRKAVNKLSGKMGNQRVKSYQLMEKAMPALVEYWSKWYNASLFQTIYEGASPQLTAGTNDDGIGLKARFHPNQYYAGSLTAFTAVGTDKAFKAGTDMDSMTATLKALSAKLVNEITQFTKTELLIEPILTAEGMPFWLLLVHPFVFKILKQDTTIISQQNSAFTSALTKHPAVQGRDFLYYDGVCILEERTGVRGLNPSATYTTADQVAADLKGTNGWLKPSASTFTSFGNILLGRDAIGLGFAEDLSYTEEEDDHGNVIEIGSRCIQGANRPDFVDDTSGTLVDSVFSKNNATKTFYETATPAVNQSSAIFWTGTATS